jgi:hypothetical protein
MVRHCFYVIVGFFVRFCGENIKMQTGEVSRISQISRIDPKITDRRDRRKISLNGTHHTTTMNMLTRSASRLVIQRIPLPLGRRAMSSSPIAASIESKLKDQLRPLHLQVLNESHMHNV